jgi:hypothetical protein
MALERGLLVEIGKKMSFPNSGAIHSENIPFPHQGTSGNPDYEG